MPTSDVCTGLRRTWVSNALLLRVADKYSVQLVYSEMRIQTRSSRVPNLCSNESKRRVKRGRYYNFDIVGCILLRYADATIRPVRFSIICFKTTEQCTRKTGCDGRTSHRALMRRQPIATDVLMIRRYEPLQQKSVKLTVILGRVTYGGAGE